MSEYREVYFTNAMIEEALQECRDLFQQPGRDFISVVQNLVGLNDLSLYDIRHMVEGWYNTVRDEHAALGGDMTGTTPAAEVAEAAAWLQRWISRPSCLHSRRDEGWGQWG